MAQDQQIITIEDIGATQVVSQQQDKEMCDDDNSITQLSLGKIDQLSFAKPQASEQSTMASSSSILSTGIATNPFKNSTNGTPKLGMSKPEDDDKQSEVGSFSMKLPSETDTTSTADAPLISLGEANKEEVKETKHGLLQSQSSTLSTGGGVAVSGRNALKLGFYDLNADFALSDDFKLVKKLGKGAYGRVMQILHIPSTREYACKRYEHVFSDTQRARRLLREMAILKEMNHPCCNKLLAVITPSKIHKDEVTPLMDLKFNEVYLVLRKCDMDLKKLIKSGKHLEETQVKSIVYDILCGLKYLHKAKIIHRDLKPGNILVNNDCTIQICDFGLARSMDGIYRQEVEVVQEECNQDGSAMDLNLDKQCSLDSNTHMSSQMSGSANKDFEDGTKTPKVNSRHIKIQSTRVYLNKGLEPNVELSTINEEQSDATSLLRENSNVSDWPSDFKSSNNTTEDISVKSSVQQNNSVPNAEKTDITSLQHIKQISSSLEDVNNLCDDPMTAPKEQQSNNVIPTAASYKLPLMMSKQSSSLKTSGDKNPKKKSTLKVGFSISEEEKTEIQVDDTQILLRSNTDTAAKKPFMKPKLVSSKLPKKSVTLKKMKMTKELTRHVVTRWYRAPEVILMNEFYSYSIDMWSVGCIFAELLSMMEENFPDPFSRVPLFPGKSCFPLSPGTAINENSMSKEEREKGDQLNKIFEVIGTPSPDEAIEEFLESQESVDYVRRLKSKPQADLSEKYPATDLSGISLLKRMIEFNPNKRPTAEEALADPYFDDIRLPEQEKFDTAQIQMPVDADGCGDMPLEDLKRMIVGEINKLDSDKFDFDNDYEEECEDY